MDCYTFQEKHTPQATIMVCYTFQEKPAIHTPSIKLHLWSATLSRKNQLYTLLKLHFMVGRVNRSLLSCSAFVWNLPWPLLSALSPSVSLCSSVYKIFWVYKIFSGPNRGFEWTASNPTATGLFIECSNCVVVFYITPDLTFYLYSIHSHFHNHSDSKSWNMAGHFQWVSLK